MDNNYRNIWLAFVQIQAVPGYAFKDLISQDQSTEDDFVGAWANILLISPTIREAIDLIPLGLAEKNFEVVFIDKIENVHSLFEYDEIDERVLEEAIWLSKTDYIFMISDRIFPYIDEA